ncbi:MAG: hypothetical protein JNK48_10540 [Bryobacterales bacterium]|nr:hypothetical protein [Bryobacterales bacterium]
MKLVRLLLLVLLVGLVAGQLGAGVVDVVVIVDESVSMATEHAWISPMLGTLDSSLATLGWSANYALVGYAKSGQGRTLAGIGTLAATQTATGSLVVTGGPEEDGWAAIHYALNNLSFTAGAALNIILITDEDRDNTNSALSYSGTLAALQGRNALLNAAVNNPFTCGTAALGIGSDGTAYKADGSGGYTSCTPGVVGNGTGNTETAYVALARATGGAAWDLNLLRKGGVTATSFTKAFVDIKVEEIQDQTGIPEPITLALVGAALAVFGCLKRR